MTNASDDAIDIAFEVGANIHQVMWRKRVSQVELGRAIGVGQSTCSKKLRGETPITVVELMQIARLLDVEPGDLLTLPRLDSNQQPSGYRPMQALHCMPEPAGDTWAEVVDLAVIRGRKAAS